MNRLGRFGRSLHPGFTLVEVLVSLAIMGIAGIVLATSFVGFLHNHDAALTRGSRDGNLALVRAAILAEPELENVEKWNDLTLPGDLSVRWRAAVNPTEIADLFSVECEVEIAPERAGESEFTRFNLMLLRPTWSRPDERETLRAASRDRLAERQFE